MSPTEYQNLNEAHSQMGQFLTDVYQTKRIHSSLGYLTPAEYEASYTRQERDGPQMVRLPKGGRFCRSG